VYFDMGSVMRFPRGERHGLVYVGMSRARSIAGLRISNWSPAAVECSPAVRHLI
jgi:hypothetical protein